MHIQRNQNKRYSVGSHAASLFTFDTATAVRSVSAFFSSSNVVSRIGVGGFIDGIVFHQLLQWHQMISAKFPPTTLNAKGVNMFWDGVFHLLMLATISAGIVLLWRLGQRRDVDKSGRLLAGGMLAGWGIFNIIEGVVDHQLLGMIMCGRLPPPQHCGTSAFWQLPLCCW
jgi:uncharacterized membrane protein